ncbi:hypothetical protein H4219_001438 [Mycoemilia scoparia]|uniref:Serine-threonine kinase receptor-associated protein n=1 Tax=Mycoemilia scoparia TaxID=417184 RepID=A0A9W8A040_9FUNG|nr:hypothetical protein H4219_001438 [Mycoemilia scoparia]
MTDNLSQLPPIKSAFSSSSNTRQIPLTCSGHTRPVVQLSFSKILTDGSYLLVSSCKGHKGAVWSTRLNDEATRAVTASADFTAKVWDTTNGNVIHTLEHKHIVRSADFVDGKCENVVTGGSERILRLFDLNKPQDPTVIAAHESTIKDVIWIPKVSAVLSASEDGKVNLTDIRSMSQIHSFSVPEPIKRISLSGGGDMITCGAGNKAYIWDSTKFNQIKVFEAPYGVSVVSVHPDHSRFVTGSISETSVRVYDFETDRELELYKGHHGPIHDICHSPDGAIYSSGSEDGTVRLWQTVPGTAYGLWQPRTV